VALSGVTAFIHCNVAAERGPKPVNIRCRPGGRCLAGGGLSFRLAAVQPSDLIPCNRKIRENTMKHSSALSGIRIRTAIGRSVAVAVLCLMPAIMPGKAEAQDATPCDPAQSNTITCDSDDVEPAAIRRIHIEIDEDNDAGISSIWHRALPWTSHTIAKLKAPAGTRCRSGMNLSESSC